ncbi:single-stranded-DNA-specific exonuclease RecJ [Bacillus sp. EAC]|uniref:single-stranded-DNA-specific exonuclease RecJ n=1 Tax=Bacillus sp. EAC TaxID=1978338 RepID=UPI000B451A7C|nr:single-stranded-DNA-specific exonuclease RecJ [Bacillus sp. EAC]
MLKSKARWKPKSSNQQEEQLLSKELQISPLLAKLLVTRGLTTIESAKQFLYEDQMSFHDPFLLEGMDISIDRVFQAIEENEKILIFGDYDADGVSSTSVLYLTLKELEANVDYYIPNRFTEGYGPNNNAFKWAHEQGYSLIITVDTGISAANEVDFANELGIDVIITDHHEPPEELPKAFAIIHPKLSPSYPFKELAGVGVVFKFASALLGREPEEYMELVSIGTVADLVPLVDENRLIVKLGVRQLKQTNRVGLKALLEISGVSHESISEETIGFAIGPRINAVGRLGDAKPAVELVLENDREMARTRAEQIDLLNRERQELVSTMTEEAIKQVHSLDSSCSNKVIIVAKEGWNAGVVGIVASKLVDRFYKPVIVLSIDREKGIAKGSARSIEGFSLFENLTKCKDILPHFGGHTLAAGMTLAIDDLEQLRHRLNEFADQIMSDDDFIPLKEVDLLCQANEISIAFINELNMLAPFGMHNPKPVLEIQEVDFINIKQIGNEGSHLKLQLKDDVTSLDAVGFGFGHVVNEIASGSKVSCLGMASINEWNGKRKPQLMIQDISVNHWQLFDLRGQEPHRLNLPSNEEKLVFIHQSDNDYTELKNKYPISTFVSYESINDSELNIQQNYVILLDLPGSENDLQTVFKNGISERIYLVFNQEELHFFSPIPSRESFKKYYSILSNTNPFDMKMYEVALCRKMGWKKEQVDFMTKVFFDLEFVTIEDGKIRLLPQTEKKDLSLSNTYAKKLASIELERLFLYSKCDELTAFFQNMKSHFSENGEALI